MLRFLLSSAALLVTPLAAQAHFLWLVAANQERTQVEVYFSDHLAPDDAALLARVAHARFFARTDGSAVDVAVDAGKPGEHWRIALPKGAQAVSSVCEYGIVQRGEGKPFLLNYYAKAILAAGDRDAAWNRLPLDLVVTVGPTDRSVQVLFQGKPLPNAELAVLDQRTGKAAAKNADDKGVLAGLPREGRLSLRVRHFEPRSGEKDGKKFEEVRHYTTLVVEPTAAGKARPTEDVVPKGGKADASVANPEATRLLAAARAARALWTNFPGFQADAEVNYAGKLHRATLRVDAEGKVTLDGIEDKEAAAWVRRVLSSIVAHRLARGGSTQPTPCAFGDDDLHHDLGRHVRVLNDELHSSYRIRDNQIVVVNRTMGASRFSIIVLDSKKTPEGKFLTTSYVVHYWDAKTSELQKSEGHEQSWTRVGGFDLPERTRVVTAARDVQSNSITLKNHRLEGAASGK